ncbi:formate/nitrite transporter family protein [Membranicola marinus]|uniref:Formate/nitrite transporter family protein n=1 Tax=Membranihabitans marinus TaxID=1227546 RepID=A0A953HUQ2_9BACT|nr:formate/nitrite transporter family protein [Membranihabitans marinus]MBY5958645.1 formate/nitrite transporter family protein [Membranihabitans marinus]
MTEKDEFEEIRKQKAIDSELEHTEESKEDSRKSHQEILSEQIEEGEAIYDINERSILISSFTAGLEIGFSYLLMGAVVTFFTGKLSEEAVMKMTTFVYPVGFIMVILGRSILFTEQTSLLSLPVLNNKRSVWDLFKLWGLVITGNLSGGFLMSGILIWIGPKLGISDHAAVEDIAIHVTDHPWFVILVSAILAGWLMGLLSWLLTSSRDTVSRILVIYMITAIMGFTGLHHSIVGNVEAFSGLVVSPEIDAWEYLRFIGLALMGNGIGGVVFVALLRYRAFINNIEDL